MGNKKKKTGRPSACNLFVPRNDPRYNYVPPIS